MTPSALPNGAAQLTDRVLTPVSGGGRQTRLREFSLPGPINSDTTNGDRTPDDQDNPAVHPATVIQVLFQAGATDLPPSSADPQFFDISPVTIAGNSGRVTAADGAGVVRVDWVDGSGYHVVMCDRLKTNSGLSGVSPTALIALANSLYGPQ
jgi:hypothetical protein